MALLSMVISQSLKENLSHLIVLEITLLLEVNGLYQIVPEDPSVEHASLEEFQTSVLRR